MSVKDMLTSGNGNPIETDLLSEHNALEVIEETKGTQSNNEVMEFNKSHCKPPCIKSACLDFKSMSENETSCFTAIDHDISESGVHFDKTTLVPNYTISNVPINILNPNDANEHVNKSGNESNISEIYFSDSSSTSSTDISYENIPITDGISNVSLLIDKDTFGTANKKTNNNNPEQEFCLSGDSLSDIKYVLKGVEEKQVNGERDQRNVNPEGKEEILDVSPDTSHALIDSLAKFNDDQLKPPSVGQLEETFVCASNEENMPKDENEKQIISNLTCSQCGEVVELLNKNATFSLEVHRQIHKVAAGECKDLSPKLIYDKNFDYMCPDCNSVITVFNNDIDLSVERHFGVCQPKGVDAITPEERIQMNRKFLDDVFYCLSSAFTLHIPYIVFEGDSLYCKVCKCTIATSEDIFITSILLHTHMTLPYHKGLLSLLKETDETLDTSEKPTKESLVEAQVFLTDTSEKPTKESLVDAQVFLNNFQCGSQNQEGKMVQDKVKKQLFLNNFQCGSQNQEGKMVQDKVKIQLFLNNFQRGSQNKEGKMIQDKVKKQLFLNNFQRGSQNQEGKMIQDKVTKQLSSLKVNDASSGNLAEQCKTTLGISSLFKYIPERYKIHQEFFSSTQEGIYCSICSHYVEHSEACLKSHIIDISHKRAFFNEIKESVTDEQKPHIKFLIMIDNKLFCSYCKVVVTSITTLESVFKEVVKHFQNTLHSD